MASKLGVLDIYSVLKRVCKLTRVLQEGEESSEEGELSSDEEDFVVTKKPEVCINILTINKQK